VFSAGTNGGSAITSNVVNRTWVLSEAVNGGSNATVTFQWDDTTEAAGFNRNNCGIAYYRNAQSSWLAPSSYAASSGTNPYTRALAGITQFNTYAVADNTGGVTVPVEMLAFNATAVKNDVILDWATASETNNSHFVIERSADGKSFVSIHTMDGAGNASQVSTYTFTDMNAFAGATTKWYYRLKQVDFDGVNRIAGTVVVSKAAEATEPTLQVFPNPFNSSITLALNGVKSETVQVRIFDMQGKLVGDEQTLTANNAGACHVTMDAYAHLQAGVYFMQVQTGAHTQRVKLVKTDR
jgi:hypothetical protein